MEKLLTKIISGYNVANFIVDTLHEVFNQCDANFEVIYVDDASNDNSLMLIHQKIKNFIMEKRLRVIESEVNGGPATASLSSSLSARGAMIHKMKTTNPIWDYLWNKCYNMSVIKNNKIKFEEGIRSAENVEFNRQYLKVTKFSSL